MAGGGSANMHTKPIWKLVFCKVEKAFFKFTERPGCNAKLDGKIQLSIALALSALIVMLILGIGVWSFAGKKEIKPHKLTILFTGDDLGTVKPCG